MHNLSMAICRFLLLFALFFITCYSNKTLVSEEGKLAYQVVDLDSLMPASTCLNSTKGSFGGLTITSLYGPCSPLGNKYSTLDSSKILQKDQYRVRSINSLTSNKYTTNAQGEAARLPLEDHDIGGGNYVVQVGFGTPEKNYNLIFDTGSEITWIKCKPCPGMCSDKTLYNPSASTTSSNTSRDFHADYKDKTYSKGYLVSDTLAISQSDVLRQFVFGCALEYTDGAFGHANGLLGVGQSGSDSFISQTNKMFAKTFCYCLPSSDSSKGFVLFGGQARETCQTKKMVPLLSDQANYYVNLVGILIGHRTLRVSSYKNSSPKTMLDSGTVITRLPRKLYSDLRSEFNKSMSQFHPADPEDVLDTCYQSEKNKKLIVPNMVLHFSNSVDVNLEASAVLWTKNRSKVCLAFAGDDMTIIGNHQQRGLNVLHDIQGRKVGFGAGSCG